MKRDMDLIRRIALVTAELPAGRKLAKLDGVEQLAFNEHVLWMAQANLVQARLHTNQDDVVVTAHVLRLTWDGCEFADSVGSETLWQKAKDSIIKPGASFTFGLLKEVLANELRNGLPALRG